MTAFLSGQVNGVTLLLAGVAFVGLRWGIRWANRTVPQPIPVARTEVTDPRALALARPHLTVIKGGRDEDVYDQEAPNQQIGEQ